MKVTLDLNKLLEDGKITQAEYEKFKGFSKDAVGSLAFNILIGFGVLAVSGAALALFPAPATSIMIGFLVLVSGLLLIHMGSEHWNILANICILIGALMAGGGIVVAGGGNLVSILLVTALFSVSGSIAKSALLVVLAVLTLSTGIGARTGYFHASYFLAIKEPIITIALFSALAIGLYGLSKFLTAKFERLAIAAARASVFLVNVGFWIGSLWGDRNLDREIIISDSTFAILWAIALVVMAAWAWYKKRRWVLNTAAIFSGIHFYTQWFENLGGSPATVLAAGILTLIFALGLKLLNTLMQRKPSRFDDGNPVLRKPANHVS